MKTQLITLLLAIFTLQGYAQKTVQDFWEPLAVPGENGFNTITTNKNGDLFIGVTSGLFKSTDNGSNWDTTGFKNPVVSILANKQNGDLFIGNANGLFFSNDGAETWNNTVLQEHVLTTCLTSNNDILVGNWGNIYKLNYSGTTIEHVMSMDRSINIRSIIEHPSGCIYAGLKSYVKPWPALQRSYDNGSTWESTGLVNTQQIWSLATNSLGHIYAGQCGNEIALYKSKDMGQTWQLLVYGSFRQILITPDDVVYVGCSNENGFWGGVVRSFDGGETWEELITGFEGRNVLKLGRSADWHLFSGGSHSSMGLYRSTFIAWDSTYRIRMATLPETGGTVTGVGNYYHGTSATLSAIPNNNYKFDYWIINHDSISADSVITIEMNEPKYVTANFKSTATILHNIETSKISLYPNPCYRTINIEPDPMDYGAQQVKIELYSMEGSLVYSAYTKMYEAISLNVDFLQPGVYNVVLRNKKRIGTTKFVKVSF